MKKEEILKIQIKNLEEGNDKIYDKYNNERLKWHYPEFVVGICVGIFVLMLLLIVVLDNNVETETLDEICTELAGQPAIYNIDISTKDIIYCNPAVESDEEILDDGRIILKGFNDIEKKWSSPACVNWCKSRDDYEKELCAHNCKKHS